ncbi:type 4a pilus biogenesis protein PilO [Thiohalobacter sp. IOR34]|uniref:type 4a pilus biogenesis protein PilO n=1 Tax=Thiohalobacter sp. IOR34 TaxID=3057176 RepID=UPI0025B0874C|nr:type 4a pilus biogenesis protein PilO [Thiohalobacter sp. IOR34]WJW75687.1 type 4a pilus biogenesis protein PilO [Thiohalobacter sp. IOR34]
MNLSEIDINDLDFSNIPNWPLAARVFLVVLVFVVVLFLGYWFDVKDQQLRLEQAERKEAELKSEFERKAAMATNLKAYEQQLEEMRQSFGTMLRQLPNKTEVADLLVDVSQTGLASGLEFELFRPQEEIPKDFYAELPISIRVKGRYHEFGAFVSGVAALPRIVTIHDVSIKPVEKTAGNGDTGEKEKGAEALVMELTAKTYRYLEEDEEGGQP